MASTSRTRTVTLPRVTNQPQPTTAISRNLPGGNFSLRFGDYVAAQPAEPVHYDANDNEVMQSDDDIQSIQNESRNRQGNSTK